MSYRENVGQFLYKATTGKKFQCAQGSYHGMETCKLTWKIVLPPFKERVGKMNEVKNADFSFNKKLYVYGLLQKGPDEEWATERETSKKYILMQRATHTKKHWQPSNDLSTKLSNKWKACIQMNKHWTWTKS